MTYDNDKHTNRFDGFLVEVGNFKLGIGSTVILGIVYLIGRHFGWA